jgi:uncharacterized membrane protein YqjE
MTNFQAQNQGFARLIAGRRGGKVALKHMKTAEMDPVETRRFRRAEKVSEPESFGLFGSIRRALGTVLALVQSRVELIAVELREEKKRALSVVIWGVTLAFLGFMSVVALMGLVVFLLWENALAVLIGFSAFFLVLALGSLFAMRSKLGKIPFEETVAQLRKDRESVSKESKGLC